MTASYEFLPAASEHRLQHAGGLKAHRTCCREADDDDGTAAGLRVRHMVRPDGSARRARCVLREELKRQSLR